MRELQLTGGARIGMANATFPFATLKVNEHRLQLNASIVGNLTFQPADIVSIESYTMIPIIGQGLKINHSVSTYNERVIFWTFKDPDSVLRQIYDTGFLSNENLTSQKYNRSIFEKQANEGSPVKKGFAIGGIVVFNLLFLSDFLLFFLGLREGFLIGNGVLTALGLLFVTSIVSLISVDFRRLILKERRDLNDIKRFAIFSMLISGCMLFQLVIITKFEF